MTDLNASKWHDSGVHDPAFPNVPVLWTLPDVCGVPATYAHDFDSHWLRISFVRAPTANMTTGISYLIASEEVRRSGGSLNTTNITLLAMRHRLLYRR